jgi:hypothetical protein
MLPLLLILVVANLLFKGFLVHQYPNSLSSEEITIIKSLPFLKGLNNYHWLRLIPVILSTLTSILAYELAYKKTKLKWLSFIVGLTFAYSPWIFVISRYLNYYIAVTTIVLLISYLLSLIRSSYKLSFLLNLSVLLAFRYFCLNSPWSYKTVVANYGELFKIFDLRNLFFVGDYLSPFIHIPKTGFFLHIEFIPFLFGLVNLMLEKNNREIKKIILYISSLGVIWFFITPENLMISYKGLLIFLGVSLTIAFGYWSLMKKVPAGRFIVLLLLAINIFFYQELFYFHFDRKNSSEWGYAEENISLWLKDNHLSLEHVYVSDDAARFIDYLPYLAKSFDPKKIVILKQDRLQNNWRNDCSGKNRICIVRESDLKLMGLEKNRAKKTINYYNGLPAYFIINR